MTSKDEKAKILLVEAAAGSGKTFRLSNEFLISIYTNFKLCKFNKNAFSKTLHSTLAVTFTKKAAGEMAERILDSIKDFFKIKYGLCDINKQKDKIEIIAQACGLKKEDIINYSEDILEVIIRNYSDFNIKTIDSLMNSLTQVMAPDLELSPNLEVEINYDEELIKKLLSYISQEADNNFDDIINLIKNISQIEKINKLYPEKKIIYKAQTLFEKSLNQTIHFISHSKQNIKKELFEIEKKIKKLYENFILPNEDFLHKGIIRQNTIDNLKDFNILSEKEKINFLLSSKALNKNSVEEIYKKNQYNANKEEIELYEDIKLSISKIAIYYSKKKPSIINSFLRDFNLYWNEERENIFVAELSKKIKESLQNLESNVIAPYLYLKLSEKYLYFLFDEFQDTSEVQFYALTPLIAEVLSSQESARLFIVGDKKQAIYRWRGGMPELMDIKNLQEQFLPQCHREVLSFNWRSRKNIIDFNNNFWQDISLQAPDEESRGKILNHFKEAKQKISPYNETRHQGFVKVENYNFNDDIVDEEKEDIILKKVIEEIENFINHNYSYSDIAVLVRKNEQVQAIQQGLLNQDIPAVSTFSLKLYESGIIKEIISFFKFINENKEIDFIAFLQSQIFKAVCPIEIKIDNIINREKNFIQIFKELYKEEFNTLFAKFYSSKSILPPYDFFLDFCQVYKIWDNFSEDTSVLKNFSSLLYTLEEKKIITLNQFLENWKNQTPIIEEFKPTLSEKQNSVTIMSMHKSKGLQFPCVIIPLKESKNRSDNIFIKEEIYYINKDLKDRNKELYDIYRDENLKNSIDELNLLYVAMTRAQQNLSILCFFNKKKTNKKELKSCINEDNIFSNSASCIANVLAGKYNEDNIYQLGEIEKKTLKDIKKKEEQEYSLNQKQISTFELEKKMLVFTSSSDDEKNKEEKLKGEKIHKALEYVTNYKDKKEFEIALIKNFKEHDIKEKEAIDFINFISDNSLEYIYINNHLVFNEKEIAGVYNKEKKFLRVDRINISEDEIIVTDYKTGKEFDKNRQQIIMYMDILSKIYPDFKIRGLILYSSINKVIKIEK